MTAITAPPTDRQAGVLAAVRDAIVRTGRPATIREIADAVGIASPNGVMCHLRALVRRGLVRRHKPGPRRDAAYLPVGEVVVAFAGGDVRVATTGPVTMTRAEWRRWLRARLREARQPG